jgi:hypothetical protein
MTAFANVAMFGWIPLVLVIFAVLPARRAVLVAYIGGFLFLPNAAYDLSGMPDFSKAMATSLAVLLGVACFHPQALTSFRPRWYDLPMLVFCLARVVTSVMNGLGVYDGVSELLERLIHWGLPYLMGRIYFSTRGGMYELILGLFIGGLIYVPLCLWEVRMSPNLHYHIYGFRSRAFGAGMRYGGYRPSVFLWSYIPVATFLAMSTVAGFCLWRSGRLRRIWGISTLVPIGVLLVTMLLTKTLTAVLLVMVAGGVLLTRGIIRKPSVLAVLVVAVPIVVGLRATGVWEAHELVRLAEAVSEERAYSLEYRFDNENILAAKALERPFFGWGGYQRSRVFDERGRDISVTDGAWIIFLGRAGLVGLASFFVIFMVALLRFDRAFPGRSWLRPDVGPAAAAAAVAAMALVNNVPNSTSNPLVHLAIGGTVAFSTRQPG